VRQVGHLPELYEDARTEKYEKFGIGFASAIRVNMHNFQEPLDQNLVLEFSTHFKIRMIVLLFY
jgi:hypothetical protein